MEDIFNCVISAASNLFQWVQVGIDVHIPHWKYQVKHHGIELLILLMWLIELSHCYFNSCINKTNLLFKVKFRQPSNHCIKVFKSVKLAYANKARVV